MLLVLPSFLCGLPAAAQSEIAEPGSPAAALLQLRSDLDRVLAGELSGDEAVQPYFEVKIVDAVAVSERIDALEHESAASRAWIAELRASLKPSESDAPAEPAPVAPVAPTAPLTPATEETSPASVADPGVEPEFAAEPEHESDVDREPDGAVAPPAPAAAVDEVAAAARHAEAAQRAAEVAEQVEAEELRLAVASRRLEILRTLDQRFKRMTEVSRRIFPSLGAPRTGLRARATRIEELAASVAAAGERGQVLSLRATSGVLIGFVSDERAQAAEFAGGASAYADLATRLETLSAKLAQEADSLEFEGQRVSDALARSASAANGQTSLDALFLAHLKKQRRLRASVSDVLTAAALGELEELRAAADALAPDPLEITTTSDAADLIERGGRYRARVEALHAAETASLRAWELAFENEVVTVLSEQASENARTTAYRFSGQIIDDVSAELELAWTRLAEGFRARQVEIPSLAAFATTEVGQSHLMRLVAALAIVGGCIFVRRRTPKITVLLVKGLAKIPALRPRVGFLVRSSGLVQSSLPVLVALLGVWLMLFVVREDGPAAPVLRAVVVPYFLYVLGRETLIGLTRRITRARPALLELAPRTLAKLQKTYATLGIALALAYALDGLARVAIGVGRVVELLDGFVLMWVVIWSVWEAHRWRTDLARNWAALVPEEEPERRERRVANWMEGSLAGFVLSPVAFLRVLLTPPATWIATLATETDIVVSLRARLLRRRSLQADAGSPKEEAELPAEYLSAFPLYPLLGEDDALLVPREEILGQVVEQWRRWQETRTDGSLVLIGEKGAGKTTVAAQLAHRVTSVEVTEYTLHGKPTTRDELVQRIAGAFDLGEVRDLDDLSAQICAGEDRVVLLDEAHNVFLRHVDGFGAYDALVEIVNATSSKVFWVLVFNSFTWRFLNESRGRAHYFRQLLHLPKWTPEELEKLVRLRNKNTSFELRFDEVLLSDAKAGSDSLALVEEAEGYFRLLWESSGGNPRLATRLWLASLRPVSDSVMSVGLFSEPSSETLAGLQDDLIFTLAAICQHENLSSSELARVLNVSEGFARFATKYLSESNFLEPKDESGDRFTLSPKHYKAVIRLLRSRHLLFDRN